MALKVTIRDEETTTQKLEERSVFRGAKFIDDNADQEIPEIEEDKSVSESPVEADEESDDDYEGEYSAGANQFYVRPVWILFEGQILWAASRYGFRLEPKEYFRRRIQMLLDFLAEKFPDKSYEELLLCLQGFFVKDNDKDKNKNGSWLDSLKNTGILYGEDKLLKNRILPLTNFRVGKGKGNESDQRSTSLPKALEYLLLERELSKHVSEEDPLAWKNCKNWLCESLNDFCDALNDFCTIFENDQSNLGLGLKRMEFHYEKNTIQHKHLKEWKEWWSKKCLNEI